MTRLWVPAAVSVILLVTGCSGATDGVPSAASSSTGEPALSSTGVEPASSAAWDPCTIPDGAIEAAGLDVETKSANLVGELPISPDWATCYWTNPLPDPWYFLGILSSTHTLDYLRERGPFEKFTSIDGLDGMRFQRKIQYDEVNCGIAFGREGGVIYLILDGWLLTAPQEDPCVEVERVARSLRPSLPSSN